MTEAHHLLIVDDHPFFIHGLEKYLSATGKYQVRSARSVPDAMALLSDFAADLIIMDVSMADGGGMGMLRRLRHQRPVKTMFLTVQIDPEDTIEALKLGIDGIALKDSDPQDIIAVIDKVLAGGTAIDPTVTEGALRFSMRHPTPILRQDDPLTPRETAIANRVCRGMRNREIAEDLDLTEGTVKVHIHNIFRKLGVNSRSELIIRQGALHVREREVWK